MIVNFKTKGGHTITTDINNITLFLDEDGRYDPDTYWCQAFDKTYELDYNTYLNIQSVMEKTVLYHDSTKIK